MEHVDRHLELLHEQIELEKKISAKKSRLNLLNQASKTKFIQRVADSCESELQKLETQYDKNKAKTIPRNPHLN